MPRLWPFPVRHPVTEVLEWNTDTMITEAAEQRIALRTVPRSILTVSHLLNSSMRSDPPVSEPVHSGKKLAASAAAEPPDEPPAMRLAPKGLPVAPQTRLRLFPPAPISGTFVFARMIAPAARRRATIGISLSGMYPRARILPWVVNKPLVFCKSFTPIGNPSSGPIGHPSCQRCVAAVAQAMALSISIAAMAFILGLKREICVRQASK
jgi:hypothetical protein